MQPAVAKRAAVQEGGASSSSNAEAMLDQVIAVARSHLDKQTQMWSVVTPSGDPFSKATSNSALSQESQFLFPPFLYRAVSECDTLAKDILDAPEAYLMELERDAKRKMAVEAVAHGNNAHTPVLHFTTSLKAVYNLLRERKDRYYGQVVRVETHLLNEKAIIDLSTPKSQKMWLNEEWETTHPVEQADLEAARVYVKKDREVLYLAPVPEEAIAWVDCVTGEVLQDPWRRSFIVVFRQLMCRLPVCRNM